MNEAKKYDNDKVRMELVPMSVVENIARVLTYGATKYSDNSWQNLDNFWNRYKGALLRHLAAIDKGELIDQESGLPHIDHVLCNAMFLSWGYHNGKGITIEQKDLDTSNQQQDETNNALIAFAQDTLGRNTELVEERLLESYSRSLQKELLNKTDLLNILVNVCKKGERDYVIEVVNSDGKVLYSFHAPTFHYVADIINGSLADLIEDINKAINESNDNR